ncbi:HopJ type III effector protein [uncultured Paraglaciecola sp.]|uniref:HopJ type III effector protein n=1 Tax=uncultured Paraglaciecola sp. TaxID=1765024 RepID=UPI0030DA769B|tara:strand:- start:16395 stop:16733 length:339 start_codon:yes stop_codon:yes gene_type:complete
MTINDLLLQLRNASDTIDFKDVIQVISQFYDYTPTRFTNGTLVNVAGSNEGSCKIFYFAQLQQLNEKHTLALFGRYYREDVLANPRGKDHNNIRNFMDTGWTELKFDGVALA